MLDRQRECMCSMEDTRLHPSTIRNVMLSSSSNLAFLYIHIQFSTPVASRSLKYEASLAYYLQNNEMGKILDKISDKEARFMTELKVFCCRCTIKLGTSSYERQSEGKALVTSWLCHTTTRTYRCTCRSDGQWCGNDCTHRLAELMYDTTIIVQ